MRAIKLKLSGKLLGLFLGLTAAFATDLSWSQVGLGLQIGIGPYGGVYLGGGPMPFGPPPIALYRGLRPGGYPGGYYAFRPAYATALPFPPPPAVVLRPSALALIPNGYPPQPNYYSYTPSLPSTFSRNGRSDSLQAFGELSSRGSNVVSPDSPDLRPGMVLPDGARVLSVGPIGGPVVDQGTVPGVNPPLESVPVPRAGAGEAAVQRAAF